MPKLKVYRTPIGFHDAYIAAPSQKAALEAWGADANLFARGVAEQVDDPALMAEPLARPGDVIKKLRGSLDEQLAALPAKAGPKTGSALKPAAKKAPRPSRAALDRAEAELSALQQQQEQEDQSLARREVELASERRDMTKRHRRELDRLTATVEKAKSAFDAATAKWRA